MPDLILTIDETANQLVRSDRNSTSLFLPPIAQGDTFKGVQLYFVKQTGNAAAPYNYVDHSADNVLFGIGKIDTLSTGGVLKIGDGTNLSADLAFNDTAANFQTALNTLALVAANGIYSVIKTPAGYFQATSNAVGTRIALSADPTGLTPLSYVDIVELQTGTSTARQVWLIKPIQRKVAGQDTWTNIAPGTVTVTPLQTGAVGFNAIQAIIIPSSAFSGSISVSVTTGTGPAVTKTTSLVGIFDSANKLQTALQTLSNVGGGNVLVTKSDDGLQFILEFTGMLKETAIPNVVINQASVIHRKGKTADVIVSRTVLESIFDGATESTQTLEIKTINAGTPTTRIHQDVTLFNTLLSTNAPAESGNNSAYPPAAQLALRSELAAGGTFVVDKATNLWDTANDQALIAGDDQTVNFQNTQDVNFDAPSLDAYQRALEITSLKTTQARKLPHLFDKVYRVAVAIEATYITWLSVGDSVAGFQPGPILDKLKNVYGETGYGFGSLLAVASGGASSSTNDFTVALNGYSFTLSASGHNVSFGLNSSGTQLYFACSVLKIKYIAQSGGGTFKIQTNNDGAGWVDETAVATARGSTALASGLTNISTNNATTVACTATVTKALGKYQIRAVWVSGTNKITAAVLINAAIGGVLNIGLAQGGQSILPSSMGATPQQILVDHLYDLDPTIISFKCYDDAATFTTYLDGWYARLSAACPNADWIDISGGPASGANDATIVSQNVVHRAKSLALNHFYFDARSVYQSYALVSSIPGWSGDGLHFTSPANEFTAAVLLSEMCLLSLFNPATRLARLGTGGGANTLLQVTADLATNFFYRLAGTSGNQISFQLIDRSALGTSLSLNFTPGAVGFYLGMNNGVGIFVDSDSNVRIGAGDIGLTADRLTGKITTPNDVSLLTAGKTLSVKSGSNALAGIVALTAGGATITSTAIDLNTVILLTIKTSGGTPGTATPKVVVSTGSAAITGAAADTSTYNWVAFKVS